MCGPERKMTSGMGFLRAVCFLFAMAPSALRAQLPQEFSNLLFNPNQSLNLQGKYYFHTKDSPEGVEFDIDKAPCPLQTDTNTKFITHGFKSNKDEMQIITEQYANNQSLNVISFDWRFAADFAEFPAAIAAVCLGRFLVSAFIPKLQKNCNIKYEQIHLIGFNMGAHLMGAVGRANKGMIARITGLDPYRKYFDGSTLFTVPGLKSNDAKFVDVLHTNGGGVGIEKAIGSVDFYPNGGELQPKCKIDASEFCNALIAKDYFAESIKIKDSFWGVRCTNYADFLHEKCKGKELAIIGEYVNSTIHGKFFYRTTGESPYGLGKNGTNPK